MPITTLKSYFDKCAIAAGSGTFAGGWGNGSYGGGTNVPFSLYPKIQMSSNGNTPPVNQAHYSTDNGALLRCPALPLASSKKIFISEIEWSYALNNGGAVPRQWVMVVDRLVATSGLGTLTTDEQTANLPTPPLPRYTDGEGVQLAVEMYSTGNTASGSTVIVRYTNSKGEANRLSQPVLFGLSNQNSNANNTLFMPLADGDTGVRSVEGVTLTGTGTAGDFGVTLFKQLAFSAMDNTAQVERQSYRNFLNAGALVEVSPGACLALYHFGPPNSTTGHGYMGRLGVITE